MSSLNEITKKLVVSKKGILAADESTSTATERLNDVGVGSTPENRRKDRQLMFEAEGVEKYISGVIMYDETIRQSSDEGEPFPELLKGKGILPGIKVDKGKIDLPKSEDEKITEGLDGLKRRLKKYSSLGAEFAKWRGVISIDKNKELPSDYAIHVNAHALARYAALCQSEGIVPIVEPEVLMGGNHNIKRCYEVTKRTLHHVFDELQSQRVNLQEMLLKPNMMVAGSETNGSEPEDVAEWTVKCFKEIVPEEVPGIVFLSGGQSEQQACENLNAINNFEDNLPWELSFSFGRALQRSELEAWRGEEENVEKAQAAFIKRCKLASAARQGEYNLDMEK